MGSDPLVAGAGWALQIELIDQTHHRVGFPTLNGRHYLLESRAALDPESAWSKVGGMNPWKGDGNVGFFVLPNGHNPVFYRVISEP